MRFLLPIAIGAVIGLVVGFIAVEQLINLVMFAVVALFAGLMLGAFPAVTDQIKGEKITAPRAALFLIGLAVPIAFSAISCNIATGNAVLENAQWYHYILFLVLGYVIAITQLVPGLSATAILMMLGYFTPLINSISITYWGENPAVFIVYACLIVGFVAGLLTVSKGMSKLIEKWRATTFFTVAGMSLGSVITMFYNTDMLDYYAKWGGAFQLWELILGIVLFVGGIAAAYVDQQGITRVGTIACSADTYSQGLVDAFALACEERGIEVVEQQSTATMNAQDFTNQFTAMVNADVELVYAVYYYDAVGPFLVTQARAAGYDGIIMGADGYDGALDYVSEGVDYSAFNNVVYTNHYDATDSSEVVQNYVTSYEERYGTTPLCFAALASDCMMMLQTAMETAGKEEIPDDAERKGLGTPATRAAILEKLVAAGFVERKGKSLIPTKAGINLVTVLPDTLTSPMLTAEWEQKLTAIARGEGDPAAFMAGISDMARELVKTYSHISEEGQKLFAPEREAVGLCPRCGKPVYEGRKNFYCSDRACRFVLWKDDRFWTSRKKELTRKMAGDLLKKGRTSVKGMWSEKKGSTYDAVVVLDDTGEKYVRFKLEFPKRKEGVNGKK